MGKYGDGDFAEKQGGGESLDAAYSNNRGEVIDGTISLDSEHQLQRGLKSRHIQFLALGGAYVTIPLPKTSASNISSELVADDICSSSQYRNRSLRRFGWYPGHRRPSTAMARLFVHDAPGLDRHELYRRDVHIPSS